MITIIPEHHTLEMMVDLFDPRVNTIVGQHQAREHIEHLREFYRHSMLGEDLAELTKRYAESVLSVDAKSIVGVAPEEVERVKQAYLVKIAAAMGMWKAQQDIVDKVNPTTVYVEGDDHTPLTRYVQNKGIVAKPLDVDNGLYALLLQGLNNRTFSYTQEQAEFIQRYREYGWMIQIDDPNSVVVVGFLHEHSMKRILEPLNPAVRQPLSAKQMKQLQEAETVLGSMSDKYKHLDMHFGQQSVYNFQI